MLPPGRAGERSSRRSAGNITVSPAATPEEEARKREEFWQLFRSKNPDWDVPEELVKEAEEATRMALSNVRDPEQMRLAAERMDRLREQIFQRIGVVDLAVPLVRESRDEL